MKGKSLQLTVEAPTYKSKRFDAVPVIDASGAVDGNTLVLNVINRHQSEAMAVTVALEDKAFSGAVTLSEVNGPDIKAENDFGKTLVSAKTRSATASGNSLAVSFPAHSYTQLKATLAPSRKHSDDPSQHSFSNSLGAAAGV